MDAAALKDLLEAVKTVGFPIVVCLYFMLREMRRDKEHTLALKEMTTALQELGAAVTTQIEKIDTKVDEISADLSAPHNIVDFLPLPPPPKEGTGK